MTLGEKLQKLRKARGWTQEELAAQVGVSRQSLSKWESDGALPDTTNVLLLADLFGVTTDYLLRPAEAVQAEPAAVPVLPAEIQLLPPKRQAPPAALLTGLVLLCLGLAIFLGLVLLSVIFPVSVARGDTFVSGVNGFLLAYGLRDVYHLSLLAALTGFVVVAVYLALQWLLPRRKGRPQTQKDP